MDPTRIKSAEGSDRRICGEGPLGYSHGEYYSVDIITVARADRGKGELASGLNTSSFVAGATSAEEASARREATTQNLHKSEISPADYGALEGDCYASARP